MDTDTDNKLDAILDAIKGLEARITKIEAGTTGASGDKAVARASAKKLSIREFLLRLPTFSARWQSGTTWRRMKAWAHSPRPILRKATATLSIVCHLT